MKPKPKLDHWIEFGNTIVGYIYESREFKPGTRVQTEAIIEPIDPISFEVRCRDGDYRLGEPGTRREHEGDFLN